MKHIATISPADYIEINQLYSKYCFALDLGDGPARAATFTPDGAFRATANNHQPESPQQMAERTSQTGNRGYRHLIMNLVITATPEGAEGRCYAILLGPWEGGDEERALKGKSAFYVDTLVKTREGWRFKSRQFWRDDDAASPFRRGEPPAKMPWR